MFKSSNENHLLFIGYVSLLDVWLPYNLSKKIKTKAVISVGILNP